MFFSGRAPEIFNHFPTKRGLPLPPPPCFFVIMVCNVMVLGCSNFWLFNLVDADNFIPTAWVYCLNTSFYLYQTKSKFRPTFSHWISTFYSFLESLHHKEADFTTSAKKFFVDFCTDALKGNMHNFSFS